MRTNMATPPGIGREEVHALGGIVALLGITAAWWALALWPVAGGGPEWLARTRYVCFGVTESGLPDLGGWIGLIGGPLGMGLILVVGWRDGFHGLLGRARTSPSFAAALSLVPLGFLLVFAGAGVRVQAAIAAPSLVELEGGLPPENYPRLDWPAPPLALVGQDGDRVDIESFRGRPVLVAFAFAHCATICPLVVRDALAAREATLGTDIEPVVLVVTLDPWRDTPSRLPAMADRWQLPSTDAWVLSGAVDEVETVLDAWQVPRSRDLRTGEVYHPALIYVVDADGRMAFASMGRADAVVALLNRL